MRLFAASYLAMVLYAQPIGWDHPYGSPSQSDFFRQQQEAQQEQRSRAREENERQYDNLMRDQYESQRQFDQMNRWMENLERRRGW